MKEAREGREGVRKEEKERGSMVEGRKQEKKKGRKGSGEEGG